MRRARPPIRAILRKMKEDSGALGTGPIGQEGILEIYESEHSHPGRVCAFFSYGLDSLPGQFWTSFSYVLEEDGSTVKLTHGGRSGENRFVFEILPKINEHVAGK